MNIAKFLRTGFFYRTPPLAASKSGRFRTLYICYVLFSEPFKVFFLQQKHNFQNITMLLEDVFVVICIYIKMSVFF